jgi:hypothetical protein
MTLRLTTDAPVDYILNETAFNLSDPICLVLGLDETLSGGPAQIARDFEECTGFYWRDWSHRLALQPEWQEAVVLAGTRIINRRWKRAFGPKPIIRHEGGYVCPGSELSGEVSIGKR